MRKSELKFLKQSMMYVRNGGRVIEIGSWMGGSSEMLAKGIKKYCPDTMLYCVDPFDEKYFKNTPGLQKKIKKSGVTDVLGYFKKRMKPYKYELLRMTSKKAFYELDEQLHFVFIDGNHKYEAVKKDIELWFSMLQDGGVVCGHDYGKWGVKKAVDELCENVRFPAESIWMVVKCKKSS